jgi:hypothetical protein
MAASATTIDNVVDVLLRHIDENKLKAIVVDLLRVQGNASFEATIKALAVKVGVLNGRAK